MDIQDHGEPQLIKYTESETPDFVIISKKSLLHPDFKNIMDTPNHDKPQFMNINYTVSETANFIIMRKLI